MMNKSLSVAIVVLVMALFLWYFFVKIGGFDLLKASKLNFWGNNRAYLAELMKNCNLGAYNEDYYVNSDTQIIGRVTSIDLRDNGVKLGVGKSDLFFSIGQAYSKSLQQLDADNKVIDEIPLEFSTREVLEALLPGNWVKIDKGPSGPTSLVVYCHE